jgi:predicted nuclease of predicted toxin-antitoxin system
MARLYADEQFPRVVVELLRDLGHDVLTVQEARNANQGIPDEDVLAFAVTNERAVLTLNRIDRVLFQYGRSPQ